MIVLARSPSPSPLRMASRVPVGKLSTDLKRDLTFARKKNENKIPAMFTDKILGLHKSQIGGSGLKDKNND